MALNPYLYFAGNCSQAIGFYQKALDAEVLRKVTGADMARDHNAGTGEGCASAPAPDAIMHAVLRISGNELFMSDGNGGISESMGGFSLSLSPVNQEEGKRWFDALSDGGEIDMEWQETFWAYGFGMLKDKFGVSWMVSVNKPH